MAIYRIFIDKIGMSHPGCRLVRNEVYQEYKRFRAGEIPASQISLRPLTATAGTKKPLFTPSATRTAPHALLPIGDVFAVDRVGREILDSFAAGQFVYWPVDLFDFFGKPIEHEYWVTDTPQSACVEYSSDPRAVWWGDKSGGYSVLDLLGYFSDVNENDGDLFLPTMGDWRPYVRQTSAPLLKVCTKEAQGLFFWKSFIFEREIYYASEELKCALEPITGTIQFDVCKEVAKRWIAEEQMQPLLDWLDAKPERQLAWARRYPAWVSKHRPLWLSMRETEQ